MMSVAKRLIRSLFNAYGFEICRSEVVRDLETLPGIQRALRIATEYGDRDLREALSLLVPYGLNSQLGQELFVMLELGFPTNGFFVEFGATNGIDLSNTYLLETRYTWKGILVEPAVQWHAALLRNRSAIVDTRCVWNRTGETLQFLDATVGSASTIERFRNTDCHAEVRESGRVYPVETVSLGQLLSDHGAPPIIDYMSVDTEGSEFDILKAFDFEAYAVRIMTIEHNYTPAREKIHKLLTSRGFTRKHEHLSQFEDWYVSTIHNT